MIRLDITYTDRMSFLMDLKILVMTVPTVIGLVFTAGLGRLKKKLDGTDDAFGVGKGKGGPSFMHNVAVIGCGYWGPNLRA